MNDASSLSDWIIEQVSDALIYVDRVGKIERWNQAACTLFGYSAAEMLGNSLDPIIPEHLRAAHWKGFSAAVDSGKTRLQGRPTLTRAVHKNGQKLYVEMTFALVADAAGATVGSVAMARDVTERVEKERAARAA
ncbi:PAS domain-containing protein [Pollutimonas harenae]|uniref:PAS domain S-box protein n=1 Tax=Pollutimonas harenae TaxID=657015 RepID=A0A853H143_9BURK|nr:PAS domain S-box protein [Pollutimonas harenae]NYT84965.1 PAS domain S-box protein [Pollutimonas harenae]TEA72645.1 PAS domain S-box protein [Pollutimonas harenae]